MSAVGMRETKLRILERLRSRPSCAAELAAELGISRVAIHRHLEDLLRKGLIRAQTIKEERRGRPRQIYQAVDPETPYAQLCNEVLSHLKSLFGSETVARVLSERNLKVASELAPQLQTLDLEGKLQRLAAFLTEEGYQARIRKEGHRWYLEEERCPRLALSQDYPELCQAELELYQELLGVSLEREERIAEGAPCCRKE
jgi:predicted ArsR family transcriptional regulator